MFAGFAAIALVIAGCMAGAECTAGQGAGGQQGVCNATDSFAYGGQVSDRSGTETYTWETTQDEARVSWGGQGASGSVTITIEDADGRQVYQETFSEGQGSSSDTTDAGEAGEWTIRVSFSGYTGQMGLGITAA